MTILPIKWIIRRIDHQIGPSPALDEPKESFNKHRTTHIKLNISKQIMIPLACQVRPKVFPKDEKQLWIR